jgi:hypothetical protein
MGAYGNGNLSANVAELRPDGKEQVDLLPERARVVLANFRFQDTHVGVCDFRHGREEEEDDEERDEAGDTQIHPLYVLEAIISIDSAGEEDPRGQERRDCVDIMSEPTCPENKPLNGMSIYSPKDPTPWTACARFSRISEYLGGPQIARNLRPVRNPTESRQTFRRHSRVGSRLERRQASTHDEHAPAKAPERSLDARRPE